MFDRLSRLLESETALWLLFVAAGTLTGAGHTDIAIFCLIVAVVADSNRSDRRAAALARQLAALEARLAAPGPADLPLRNEAPAGQA